MSRILIKNGTIVSMDRQTGDLRGDLLVENERIAAISPAIEASDAQIIDASKMIVSPGLINSHIHTWETGLRGIAGDWTMPQYVQAMHRGLATHFRPDDINIANLMGDVSYTSEVTRLAAVLLAPSINFPLSEQPTDQMVLDAVDTAIKP